MDIQVIQHEKRCSDNRDCAEDNGSYESTTERYMLAMGTSIGRMAQALAASRTVSFPFVLHLSLWGTKRLRSDNNAPWSITGFDRGDHPTARQIDWCQVSR
jgi:hypothetical protein